MNSPASNPPNPFPYSFNDLLARLRNDFPDVLFEESPDFRWSAERRTVYYSTDDSYHPVWSLLHEVGHMVAKHQRYRDDNGLVLMEVEAWAEAQKLAGRYGVHVDEDYIQDCLDSYRDWQYRRSTCPECLQTGVEPQRGRYRCINCGRQWQVSPNRFCRVYRQTKNLRD